ncbi:hypothetical protein AC1_1219 [Clostridium perfringens B str. ATCC 3626]|uniref:Uncharacterized protein n=1 Tax=Clostridium perfringens B str. ATCC 3626 TaxID=451754 RepID=A0AAV3BLF9_CLOPF|nr:hypothetical protein AC1_1219 [Clostridium perfringens B str. ATCC 3626]
MFYINYEECKYHRKSEKITKKIKFYINYEECKLAPYVGSKQIAKSFILTMRNVNAL